MYGSEGMATVFNEKVNSGRQLYYRTKEKEYYMVLPLSGSMSNLTKVPVQGGLGNVGKLYSRPFSNDINNKLENF
jgi:hypothetical protein